MHLARTNAVLPLAAASDLTDKVGCLVVRIGDTVALATNPAVKPFGVLLTDGTPGEQVTVAVATGGLAGTVRVKLAAAVTISGAFLQLAANGRVAPENPADPSRCVCALALETGAINELIEAVVFNPLTYRVAPPELKTAAFNALAGGRYSADTTASAFAGTIPPAPTVGDRIYFQDPQGSWATHNFTIARNGNLVGGVASDLVCNVNDSSLWLEWVGGAMGWQVFRNS